MRNRLPALVAIGALVVLAGVVARGSSAVPVGESKPLIGWLRWPWPASSDTQAREAPPRGRVVEVRGTWAIVVEWAILLLPVIALLLAITAAVIMSVRRRKRELPSPIVRSQVEPTGTGDRASALLKAVHAAQRVLAEHVGGPPGDAVIAAWLELERVAAQSGAGKHAHQTPTEFTDTLVSEHAAIQRAVTDLRNLYHRARFGPPGAVSTWQAEAARRALDEITASLVAR
jgi:hypothetical protein